MSRRIRCFLMVRTERQYLMLVSLSKEGGCPQNNGSLHRGQNILSDGLPVTESGEIDTRPYWNDRAHPDWPTTCACGYVFGGEDMHSSSTQAYFRRQDTGEEMRLGDAPEGAMWFIPEEHTVEGSRYWKARGGGPHLYIKTPGGHWDVDAIANNGDGWERSGEAPNVTAHPSIQIGNRYHGWLRDGWLEEC